MDENLRADTHRPPDPGPVLDDIRIAEEQIARGEGIEHDAALQQVLADLASGRRTTGRIRRVIR